MPAVAKRNGSPQQDATPKAAAKPSSVSSTCPVPTAREKPFAGVSAMIGPLPPVRHPFTTSSNYSLKIFLKTTAMTRAGLAIGELSRRTRGNIETIRYYERIGVLPVPERVGRYRRYGAADVRRLVFIRRARELGFTLDEVRALLKLAESDDRKTAYADVRNIAASHLAEIKAKIADLRAMERTLADAVRRCGVDEVSGSPLIDTLSGNA